jgi:hypothetical protein
MSVLLTGPDRQKCKVSSTLNRSSEFSSKNMFVEGDNCWNSDQVSECVCQYVSGAAAGFDDYFILFDNRDPISTYYSIFCVTLKYLNYV